MVRPQFGGGGESSLGHQSQPNPYARQMTQESPFMPGFLMIANDPNYLSQPPDTTSSSQDPSNSSVNASHIIANDAEGTNLRTQGCSTPAIPHDEQYGGLGQLLHGDYDEYGNLLNTPGQAFLPPYTEIQFSSAVDPALAAQPPPQGHGQHYNQPWISTDTVRSRLREYHSIIPQSHEHDHLLGGWIRSARAFLERLESGRATNHDVILLSLIAGERPEIIGDYLLGSNTRLRDHSLYVSAPGENASTRNFSASASQNPGRAQLAPSQTGRRRHKGRSGCIQPPKKRVAKWRWPHTSQQTYSQARNAFMENKDACKKRTPTCSDLSSDKPYICTLGCGQVFTKLGDWRRHEWDNRPLYGYLCNLGDKVTSAAGDHCSKCGKRPSEGTCECYSTHGSQKRPCKEKPFISGRGRRIFSREDKFKEHFSTHHPGLAVEGYISKAKVIIESNFERICGFCGSPFTDFEQWAKHVASQVKSKKSLDGWQDPWRCPPAPSICINSGDVPEYYASIFSADSTENEEDEDIEDQDEEDDVDDSMESRERDDHDPDVGASGGSASTFNTGMGFGNFFSTGESTEGSHAQGYDQPYDYQNLGWSSHVQAIHRSPFHGTAEIARHLSDRFINRRAERPLFEPLNAIRSGIRLVYLSPAGTTDGTLSCQLHVASLDQCPPYEALSYVGGDPSPHMRISVNGRDIFVRRHLHEALLMLQSEDEFRVLWVDAICIDQGDVAERRSQIALMSRIYRQATRVVIWLGSRLNYEAPTHAPEEVQAKTETVRRQAKRDSWVVQTRRTPYYTRDNLGSSLYSWVYFIQQALLARNAEYWRNHSLMPPLSAVSRWVPERGQQENQACFNTSRPYPRPSYGSMQPLAAGSNTRSMKTTRGHSSSSCGSNVGYISSRSSDGGSFGGFSAPSGSALFPEARTYDIHRRSAYYRDLNIPLPREDWLNGPSQSHAHWSPTRSHSVMQAPYEPVAVGQRAPHSRQAAPQRYSSAMSRSLPYDSPLMSSNRQSPQTNSTLMIRRPHTDEYYRHLDLLDRGEVSPFGSGDAPWHGMASMSISSRQMHGSRRR